MTSPQDRIRIRYNAVPTLLRFHASNALCRMVMGPRGSSKSVGCMWEAILRGCRQAPAANGVRYTRGAVIRSTYPLLQTTTLKTILSWFPAPFSEVKMTAPITVKITLPLPDKTTACIEMILISADRDADIAKLKSLELTWVWVNEVVGDTDSEDSGIPKAVFDQAFGSINRFPPKAIAPLTWSGVFGDTNPCDTDHWFYKTFEEMKPQGYELYRQPPALMYDERQSPAVLVRNIGMKHPLGDAENIENLPAGWKYYDDMATGKTKEWIKVYVGGEYGTVATGKPVYPEYNDSRHCSPVPLQIYTGLPLKIGFDNTGLNPAVVIGQVAPNGQCRILHSVRAQEIGLRTFCLEIVIPLLNTRFPNMQYQATGDPAGNQRLSQAQTDVKTAFQIMAECGIHATPAVTNDFLPRREAVAALLKRSVGDGEPGFIMDPEHNKLLRDGFLGKYRFEKMQVSGRGDAYKDRPVKDKYSEPQDGLQYLAMMIEGVGKELSRHESPVLTQEQMKVHPADHSAWTM